VQESSLAPRPRYEADGIVLRTLTTNDEYDEAVALQDEIWGAGFTDRVPASILRVAQKVGGFKKLSVIADLLDDKGK